MPKSFGKGGYDNIPLDKRLLTGQGVKIWKSLSATSHRSSLRNIACNWIQSSLAFVLQRNHPSCVRHSLLDTKEELVKKRRNSLQQVGISIPLSKEQIPDQE